MSPSLPKSRHTIWARQPEQVLLLYEVLYGTQMTHSLDKMHGQDAHAPSGAVDKVSRFFCSHDQNSIVQAQVVRRFSLRLNYLHQEQRWL